MFCAPRRKFESRMDLETSLSAVKGGQTTMSTSFMFASSILRSPTRSRASATVLFIFQFPAIMSLRDLFMKSQSSVVNSPYRFLFFGQVSDAGQHLPFKKFQAGAAPRAHESDFIAQFGFVQRLHAVPTADDAF